LIIEGSTNALGINMEVQIFGERCSGTNFVTEMIKLNCPQAKLSNPLGWKHGYGHSF